MQQSLSRTTYDLMNYYGTGNFGLFERCFNRALDHAMLGLEVDENDRKKYRNSVFRYLRSLGYVEVFNYGGKTTWSVPTPSLIQREETSFVLVGGSQAEWLISEYFTDSRRIEGFQNGQPKIDIDPLEFEINGTLAQKLSSQAGFQLSLNYQKRLFDFLPSLQTVYGKVLQIIDGTLILDPVHSHVYSIEEKQWQSFTDGTPTEEGLYKTQFLDMKTNFFLVTVDRHRSRFVHRIYSSEWSLICLLGKLKRKLRLRYEDQLKQLMIERTNYLNFPTLVERCLRSGTMTSPNYDKNWATYGNIDIRSYWSLLSKYPIFEVEI